MSTAVEQDPASRPTNYRLLSDQRHADRRDPLGFDQIAEQLARMVLESRTSSPFTLGIEGGWGTGKSSLMCRLQEQLKSQQPLVKTVWFDAWTADEGQALESLIKSALAQLDRNILRRLARMRRLSGWARLATTLAGGWFRVGALVDRVWDQLAIDPTSRNELQALLDREMRAWLARDSDDVPDGRLLVVFVDDLDRCSPANVFQIFEAIKLYLDTYGFVFVVGYDKTVVSDVVLRHKQYSSTIKSADYLEKIIQVSYRMPRPSEDSAIDLIDAYLAQAGTSELFGDPSVKSLVLARSDTNPRRIKRFINSFILEYSLDREWQEEFTAADVVRVVVLYMYFPQFADLLHAPGDDDPIQMFLDYVETRQILKDRPKAEDVQAWVTVVEFASKYGLPRVEPEQGAERMAQELSSPPFPACFTELAPHREFAELLRSLGDVENRERLRAKLQRRRPAVNVDSPAPSDGEGADSRPEISFRPLPEPAAPYPYRLHLTDHLTEEALERLHDGAVTFHATGSTGGVKQPAPQLAVANAMAADASSSKAAFFYHLGDVVHWDGREEFYPAQFDRPYANYEGPIFAIPGNHDGDADDVPSFASFRASFCAPAASPPGAETRTMDQPHLYWTLDAELLTIVGLCTNLPEGGQVDAEQAAWLTVELSAAPIDRPLVVALHHDPYGAGMPSRSNRMVTLLDRAFEEAERLPELVLSAHAHNYQRFHKSYGHKTVVYIVAGAGGYFRVRQTRVTRMPLDIAPNCVLMKYVDTMHGFLRVSAADGNLRTEYIGVSQDGGSQLMDSLEFGRAADVQP